MDQEKCLTERQGSRLLLACLTIYVIGMLAHAVKQPVLTFLLAVSFGIWLYRWVPGGRGTIDFKVGLAVGATLALIGYDLIHSFWDLFG